jgi:hypothetical protein
MPRLTLNKLCELVGQDRRVIAPLLDGVPYTEGPNRSHLYQTTEALPAIYRCRHKDSGPETTLAEAKIRNEIAAAKLREISAKQKLEELVPAEISRMAINAFIKYVALRFDELRRRGLIDREWIDQCGARFQAIFVDLAVQHGLEFLKAMFKPEDIQALKDRGFPEQPPRGQSQP